MKVYAVSCSVRLCGNRYQTAETFLDTMPTQVHNDIWIDYAAPLLSQPRTGRLLCSDTHLETCKINWHSWWQSIRRWVRHMLANIDVSCQIQTSSDGCREETTLSLTTGNHASIPSNPRSDQYHSSGGSPSEFGVEISEICAQTRGGTFHRPSRALQSRLRKPKYCSVYVHWLALTAAYHFLVLCTPRRLVQEHRWTWTG